MDGKNNGKPYEQMDDLGGKNPYFWKHPYLAKWFILFHQPIDFPSIAGVPFPQFPSVAYISGSSNPPEKKNIFLVAKKMVQKKKLKPIWVINKPWFFIIYFGSIGKTYGPIKMTNNQPLSWISTLG